MPQTKSKPIRGMPAEKALHVNGISLTHFEWEPVSEKAAPILLFAHATGFHARVFDAIIDEFLEHRVLSVDMRGHGRSGGGPINDWRILAQDIEALASELDLRDVVGIGHSMGAHTLLQTAADRPGIFSRLVLFDPVILTPEYYEIDAPLFTPDNPHPAAKRKSEFASIEEMIARFETRDPYCLFDRRVFEDYCRFGLLDAPDGTGKVLACAPEVEASVYGSSRSNKGIFDAARAVDIPVTIVRAKQTSAMDFKGSPTWPELASIMPNGTDLHRPDMTHFHPFQDPADAARIIKRAMAD